MQIYILKKIKKISQIHLYITTLYINVIITEYFKSQSVDFIVSFMPFNALKSFSLRFI